MVDEKTLYDTFSRFGSLITAPKIARDDNSLSKGYGFVSYANFEASDDAIANMNGQFLMNKEISVQYAYKKDGKGERHGDQAERMLASQAKQHGVVPDRQQLPPGLLMNGLVPAGSTGGMMNGPPSTPMNGGAPPGIPLGFPPNGNFQNVPPPQQQQRPNVPLGPPPSGLPSRPPPSQASYGGPQDFHPQNFNQPGFPPQLPPGFGPPGQMGAMPPGMPPGFGFAPPPQQQQQQGFNRR